MLLDVVVAHPDDETIWAGGLIHHMVRQGHDVRVACVSGEDSAERVREFHAACGVLGVVRAEVLCPAWPSANPVVLRPGAALLTHNASGELWWNRDHSLTRAWAMHASERLALLLSFGPGGLQDMTFALPPESVAAKDAAARLYHTQEDVMTRLYWGRTRTTETYAVGCVP